MTTLPSFVELMATLGISPADKLSATARPSSSSLSSRSPSPNLLLVPSGSPTRSRSSPSLRDQSSPRSRTARFSPYRPTHRRGSFSSSSSSSSSSPEMGRRSLRATSTSPHPSPSLRRRVDNKLTVNVYGSASDLSANTPISSYVRRKTPSGSPVSPNFSYDLSIESPSGSPMPFSLPTLPAYLPQSGASDSFPLTPNSDLDNLPIHTSPDTKTTGLPVVMDVDVFTRRSRYHTGIRISTPPLSADLRGKLSTNRPVHVT